jgi:hypothetical protein
MPTLNGAKLMLMASCRDLMLSAGEALFSGLLWAPASIGVLHYHRYISYALP